MLPFSWTKEKYFDMPNYRTTSTSDMRYPCPRCWKTYTTKSAMTAHFKYDCGKPPRFECPYCGQLSKRKFNIQYHVRHKHPMKPFACTTSGYVQPVSSTNSRKKLKKRDPLYNFHTGKFHCPNCNNGYGRRDTMLGHFRYECGKAPRYKCPYCSLCSKKTSNIYQHVRCMHPKEPVTLVKLY
ncbi:hypothetical protein M0804_007719 [Polistes exclamans]|nr:hypothetical protein M0804_007719 [Polistes exclamans]